MNLYDKIISGTFESDTQVVPSRPWFLFKEIEIKVSGVRETTVSFQTRSEFLTYKGLLKLYKILNLP